MLLSPLLLSSAFLPQAAKEAIIIRARTAARIFFTFIRFTFSSFLFIFQLTLRNTLVQSSRKRSNTRKFLRSALKGSVK